MSFLRRLFRRPEVVLPPDPFGEPPREPAAQPDPAFEGAKVAVTQAISNTFN